MAELVNSVSHIRFLNLLNLEKIARVYRCIVSSRKCSKKDIWESKTSKTPLKTQNYPVFFDRFQGIQNNHVEQKFQNSEEVFEMIPLNRIEQDA